MLFPLAVRLAVAALPLFGLLTAGPAAADLQLKFGVYTADKPTAVVRQFRPVLDALERGLSRLRNEPVEISMQVARTYEQGVEDLVQGRVDFSRFGPASYIEARRANPQLRIIVAEANAGKKTFNGVICVRSDSPIEDISALAGKRFAFGDENSTIGRYLAQLYLAEHGINAHDLSDYAYLERHDSVGAAVAAGSYDAGALKESTFDKLFKQGKLLRALAVFPNVTKPWIARAGLDAELFEQLRRVMLGMADDAAFAALKKDGFLAAEDADYDRIRIAIEDNRRFFAD